MEKQSTRNILRMLTTGDLSLWRVVLQGLESSSRLEFEELLMTLLGF